MAPRKEKTEKATADQGAEPQPKRKTRLYMIASLRNERL